MFDKKIKFIYDFNINQLKKLGPYFTIEKLAEIDIHPAIETYVRAAVDCLIYQDRQALIGNSLFDYSGDDVARHMAEVDVILKQRKKFSLKYYAGLFEEAINFNVNFICSPKQELLKIVFGDKKHMPTGEILQRLDHLYYYDYFNKVIVSFLSKKKIIALNKDEFSELVNRVDNISAESNQRDILLNFVSNAASFFNIGNTGKTTIPVEAFNMFLYEKELTRYSEALSQTMGDNVLYEYDATFYNKVIDAVIEEKVEYVSNVTKNDNAFSLDEEDALSDFEGGEIGEEEFSPADEFKNPEQVESNEVLEEEFEDSPDKIELSDDVTIPEDEEGTEIPGKITSFFGESFEDESTSMLEPEEEEFEVADELNVTFEEVEEDNPVETPAPLEDIPDDKPSNNDIDAMFNSVGFDAGEEDSEIPDSEAAEEDEEFSSFFKKQEEPEEIDPAEEDELTDEEINFPNFDDTDNAPDDMTDIQEEPEEHEDPFAELHAQDMDSLEDAVDTPDENVSFNASMGIAFNGDDEVHEEINPVSHSIDPAELLEHKKMPKIIQEIFEYDMEEFADTIEIIANSDSKEKVLDVLDRLFSRNGVDKSSKEAQNFIEIILEYFK